MYSFIQLTPNIIIAGINIAFCRNIVIIINIIPFNFPKTYIHDAIVYPKQNPLTKIMPKTIGIPIIVVPANHNENTNIILFFTSFCNSPM